VAFDEPFETRWNMVEEINLDQPIIDLQTVVKTAVEKITAAICHCDEQVLQWQNRKQNLQNELECVKMQFDGITTSKDVTIPTLIKNYLENHGPARNRDIRKFLLSQGKRTNPGVALSRLLQSGTLKSKERGVYEIA
jgi:hypothetical protein